MFEFVKIQFAETHSSWVRYDSPVASCFWKTDFGKGRTLDNSFVFNAAIEGESMISGPSLFHSDKQ